MKVKSTNERLLHTHVSSSAKSRDATKRCHWLQQFCLMNIFQHVGKPAIIAAYCMQKLHAIIAHETTVLKIQLGHFF